MERENAWKTYKEKDKKELEQLNGDYIEFLSVGKTERECVRETIRQAEEKGYQSLESVLKKGQKLQKGDINNVFYSDFDEQFQAVGIIVIILLVLDVLIYETKVGHPKRNKLFSRKL